ncbi:ricin-type beta-trefoil lectin domain protein [Kutzneria chonburiensis]|uniref:Alpha-galactosidase n=2 Tax=Kutzneria chonburiensis TaxID=1483604 RepID=A0ABV6N8F7_9PSEU
MRSTLLLAAVTAASLLTPVTAAAAAPATPATLADTPPMGWNDWAHYQCDFTEQTILANADALVSTGLAAKGYNTVTIDDCWMSKSRDGKGNLVADPARFPDGMAYVGRYLHDKGLRFGIYEDAGTLTCGGYPGSWDHFQQDADLFASWGVDYLKLDGCNLPSVAGQTEEQTYRGAYAAQSAALAKTGRAIVFSESAPAYFQGTPDWYTILGWVKQYGQLWREGWDVATYDAKKPDASRWGSVLGNYGYNNPLGRYAAPGNWNDPDFLIAGDRGLTADESRSQVALWAMMAAPMIMSSDVTKLSADAVKTLGNKDIIAVDQDRLGRQGTVYAQNGTTDILYRPLANGDRAVAILNRSAASVTTSTTAGLPSCSFTAKDLWTGKSSNAVSATIPAHGTAIFRVTPGKDCGTVKPIGQISGTSGKCMDDSNSGTANGNPVILWPCTGNANQRWQLSNGTVQSLGKCLANSGNKAVLSTCDGSAGQQWSYKLNGNLVNQNLCLDVTGGGSDNGTALGLYACGNNQLNQIWSLPA